MKSFADGAEDGLVVFTLGSLIPVSSMPKETIDIFLRVFSKLPQRILWKWEAAIPSDLPKNIKMMKWLPQQDLLGEPNQCPNCITVLMLTVSIMIYRPSQH